MQEDMLQEDMLHSLDHSGFVCIARHQVAASPWLTKCNALYSRDATIGKTQCVALRVANNILLAALHQRVSNFERLCKNLDTAGQSDDTTSDATFASHIYKPHAHILH